MQKAPEPLADLFMRQKLTALYGGLATLHGFNEAIFLLEVARDNILDNLIQFDALLDCALLEASLQIGVKLDFHGIKIR